MWSRDRVQHGQHVSQRRRRWSLLRSRRFQSFHMNQPRLCTAASRRTRVSHEPPGQREVATDCPARPGSRGSSVENGSAKQLSRSFYPLLLPWTRPVWRRMCPSVPAKARDRDREPVPGVSSSDSRPWRTRMNQAAPPARNFAKLRGPSTRLPDRLPRTTVLRSARADGCRRSRGPA